MLFAGIQQQVEMQILELAQYGAFKSVCEAKHHLDGLELIQNLPLQARTSCTPACLVTFTACRSQGTVVCTAGRNTPASYPRPLWSGGSVHSLGPACRVSFRGTRLQEARCGLITGLLSRARPVHKTQLRSKTRSCTGPGTALLAGSARPSGRCRRHCREHRPPKLSITLNMPV